MRRERTKDFSEQLLLWGSLIILLFYGCYHLYQLDWSTTLFEQKKKEGKKVQYFDYGTLEGNQYCNDFFDFKITIPNNYRANYKWYDLQYSSLTEADTIQVLKKLPHEIASAELLKIDPQFVKSELFSNDELAKTRYEELLRKLNGTSHYLRILVLDVPYHTATVYDGQYFDNQLIRDKKEISGERFDVYEGCFNQGTMFTKTKVKNVLCFTKERKGYYFNIMLYYDTEEQQCELLNMVDNLSFNNTL
ncbi:hypothetical protein [Maribacter sp. 2210JD10-5]|uniref:hypothetical protein n=1 Tax=Maribacter sp. 2210JD10-5 TaxID=3386272 RepID=UPI0039BC64E2